MIHNNPFLSKTFIKKWLSHFLDDQKEVSFNLFPDLNFFKSAKKLVYINTAKTNTKGITYTIAKEESNTSLKKTFFNL